MSVGECTLCHASKRLLVHHIDRNHSNDAPSNRISICYQCHAREHRRYTVPGVKPRSERVFDADLPRLSTSFIRAQYEQYSPRA